MIIYDDRCQTIQKWDKDRAAIQIRFPYLKRKVKRRLISDKMQEKSTASHSLQLSRINTFRQYCSCKKLFTKQNRPMILCKSCYYICCQSCIADLVRIHGTEEEIECSTCTMNNTISKSVPDQQTEKIIGIVRRREDDLNAKTQNQIQNLKKIARKYGEENKKYKLQNDRLSAEVDSSQKIHASLTLELQQKEKEFKKLSERMESKQSQYIELKEENQMIQGKYEKERQKNEEVSEYIKKIEADRKELEKKYSILEFQRKENERMVEQLKEKLTKTEEEREVQKKKLTEVKEHYSNLEEHLEQKRQYHYKSFIDFAKKEFGQKLVIPPMKENDNSQKKIKLNEKSHSSSEQSSLGALEEEGKSQGKSENGQQNVMTDETTLCQIEEKSKINVEFSEVEINLKEEDSNKVEKEPENEVSKEKQSQVEQNISKIEETKEANEKEVKPIQYSKNSEEKISAKPKYIEKVKQTFEKNVQNKLCASKQTKNKEKKEESKKQPKKNSFDTNRSKKSQKPFIDPNISFDVKDQNLIQNSDSYNSEFDEYFEYQQEGPFSKNQAYSKEYYGQREPPRQNFQSNQQIPPSLRNKREPRKRADSHIQELLPEHYFSHKQREYDQFIQQKRLQLSKSKNTFTYDMQARKVYFEDEVVKYLKSLYKYTVLEDYEYYLIIQMQTRKDEASKKLQMLFQIKLLKDPQLFSLQIQLYACTLNTIGVVRLQGKSLHNIINLSGITHLKLIDISQNKLRSIKELEGCVSVQKLFVNHNFLQNVKGIKNMKKLSLFSFNQNLVGFTGYQYLTKTVCAKALKKLYFGSSKTFEYNDKFMQVLLSDNCLPNLTQINILNQIFEYASKTVSNYNRKYRSGQKSLELFYIQQL